MKIDANPSQTRRRIIRKSIESIQDLTLLAAKLPNDDFNEIFQENLIQTFLKSLLYDSNRIKENKLSVDAELASLIASVSVKACKDGYTTINRDTPNITETVIDYLNRTIAICGEIGQKIILENIEKENIQKNKKYICRIEEITNKDKDRFLEYADKELSLGIDLTSVHVDIDKEHLSDKHNQIFFTFSFEGGSDVIGTIKLDFDFDENICGFEYISNIDDSEDVDTKNVDTKNVEKSLIIKPYYKYHLLLK